MQGLLKNDDYLALIFISSTQWGKLEIFYHVAFLRCLGSVIFEDNLVFDVEKENSPLLQADERALGHIDRL